MKITVICLVRIINYIFKLLLKIRVKYCNKVNITGPVFHDSSHNTKLYMVLFFRKCFYLYTVDMCVSNFKVHVLQVKYLKNHDNVLARKSRNLSSVHVLKYNPVLYHQGFVW